MRIWLTWLCLALLGTCNGRVVKVLKKISDGTRYPYPPEEDTQSNHILLNHQSNEAINNISTENDQDGQEVLLLFPPEVFRPESENVTPSKEDSNFNFVNVVPSPSPSIDFDNGSSNVPSLPLEPPVDSSLSSSSVPPPPTLPPEKESQTPQLQEHSGPPAIPISLPLPSTEYGPPPLLTIVGCCLPPAPTVAPYPPPPPTLPPDEDSEPVAIPSFPPNPFPLNPPSEIVTSSVAPYSPPHPTLPPDEESGPMTTPQSVPNPPITPAAEYGLPPLQKLPEEGSLSAEGKPTSEKGQSVAVTHGYQHPSIIVLYPSLVLIEKLPSTVFTKQYVPSFPKTRFVPKLKFTPFRQILFKQLPVFPTVYRFGPDKLPIKVQPPVRHSADVHPPSTKLPKLQGEYGLPSYEYGALPASQTETFKQTSS